MKGERLFGVGGTFGAGDVLAYRLVMALPLWMTPAMLPYAGSAKEHEALEPSGPLASFAERWLLGYRRPSPMEDGDG